ncbi:thioredoxin fold domain-containing protein [filamentous cyanobacterium LEGE 11480]|uniref:Thioredoxin fold domain-containing protein n=1 Tax=Romeriopsis navalis LEGE 11480 TaxID=2777977 RepID=A0A928Z6C6_9CYAN|nr:thioredoxin family protein [Romeriopsis navalis]MBE9032105.1 thioredoxin fold domain-containing protein [Romeriopsis navalis LEGE 11480]
MTANLPDSPQPDANRLRNLLIAIVAIVLAVVFALGLKTQTSSASLPAMAKASVPLDVALRNDKPTLMEFYADWCTSCQRMAPEMAELKETYGDRVNFVMLNVDNEKWLPEIVAYRVDGIPHFSYLQANNEPVAQAIGEQPEKVLEENLIALVDGQTLPIAMAQGETSAYTPPNATKTVQKSTPDDPRAHGSQVKG